MDYRSIVQLIIILVGVVFVIYEILLKFNGVDDDTANILVYEATKKRLLFLPFALGVIAGHLFLGTSLKVIPDSNVVPFLGNEVLVILGMVIIALILFLISNKVKNRSRIFLTSLLVLGLLYGNFFWSMND
jgi:hypothetical protein